MASIVTIASVREWTCPHCGELHRMDHDLADLTNAECRQCERVTLLRVLDGNSIQTGDPQ